MKEALVKACQDAGGDLLVWWLETPEGKALLQTLGMENLIPQHDGLVNPYKEYQSPTGLFPDGLPSAPSRGDTSGKQGFDYKIDKSAILDLVKEGYNISTGNNYKPVPLEVQAKYTTGDATFEIKAKSSMDISKFNPFDRQPYSVEASLTIKDVGGGPRNVGLPPYAGDELAKRYLYEKEIDNLNRILEEHRRRFQR